MPMQRARTSSVIQQSLQSRRFARLSRCTLSIYTCPHNPPEHKSAETQQQGWRRPEKNRSAGDPGPVKYKVAITLKQERPYLIIRVSRQQHSVYLTPEVQCNHRIGPGKIGVQALRATKFRNQGVIATPELIVWKRMGFNRCPTHRHQRPAEDQQHYSREMAFHRDSNRDNRGASVNSQSSRLTMPTCRY